MKLFFGLGPRLSHQAEFPRWGDQHYASSVDRRSGVMIDARPGRETRNCYLSIMAGREQILLSSEKEAMHSRQYY